MNVILDFHEEKKNLVHTLAPTHVNLDSVPDTWYNNTTLRGDNYV